MQTVAIVVHLMIVATLIATVLLQKSEGGGLGMLAGGTAGYEAGGVPGAVAGAAAGRAAKMFNNRAVIKQAEKAAEAIRRRSPLGMANPPILPPKTSVALSALRPARCATIRRTMRPTRSAR